MYLKITQFGLSSCLARHSHVCTLTCSIDKNHNNMCSGTEHADAWCIINISTTFHATKRDSIRTARTKNSR
ncbi:hypothetical protein L9F63_021049 [Diploptera punctata]|uniref:Uncharacterized protein n=1 Tax=Diploptera punctata TaxID=6984 RepID=A0AAD8ECD4_DIPPU|nr:hypothetical protein L9F63_021049 [Diploptera punctata]